MPFIMVLGGMGFMIGTGGTALVSKIMGQRDGERANRTFSMMIWVTVMLGAVLTALGLVFMEPMARFRAPMRIPLTTVSATDASLLPLPCPSCSRMCSRASS